MDKRIEEYEAGVADFLPVSKLYYFFRYHSYITVFWVVPKPLIHRYYAGFPKQPFCVY